jgi:8-oxo-dGTP diphosphatase
MLIKRGMENKDQKIWVSQKILISRPDGKFLTLRRSKTAPSRPLKWDLPGGTLGLGEDTKEAMIREIKEETGLEVKNLKVADAVSAFNDRKEFWASVFYSGQAVEDKVVLSYEHDDYKWVTLEELVELETSPRIKKFVQDFKNENDRPKVGIGVMIFKNGKVLLGKRKGSHGAGEFAFPGGHLEYMESFEDCAKRETMEEAGITIKNIKFLCTSNIIAYKPKHYVDVGIIADWESGEPKVLEPEKRESWDWFDIDKIPEPLLYICKLYFRAYKTGENYFDIGNE